METNTTTDVKSVLEKLGYRLSDFGDSWRTSALYRGGDNPTALKIYKNSGVWTDYVDGNKSMPLAALVQKTLGTTDHKIVSEYIKTEKTDTFQYNKKKSKIQMEETFPEQALERLLPHYKFYNSKGLSDQTLKFYKCGLATTGAMNNRYVFPIYNETGKICGFSGRDASNSQNRPKWKHMGRKTNWSYFLYLGSNSKLEVLESIDQKKEIILVESIGDSMALFENGYKNNLVTFGLDASPKLITTLITLNPEKIIISTNNDSSSDKNRGLESAVKIFIKLLKHFNIDSLTIKPPLKNDFGLMQELEIDFNIWYNKSPDKNKMYKYILNCARNFGKTLFSPTKEKLIKSRILNE
ncbi:MAG TPA: hypothetical protein DEG69_12025 [Flavobacteriaceae bacterium]|nr:hypothetical protein [Flavobacteriaceae bacterium]